MKSNTFSREMTFSIKGCLRTIMNYQAREIFRPGRIVDAIIELDKAIFRPLKRKTSGIRPEALRSFGHK